PVARRRVRGTYCLVMPDILNVAIIGCGGVALQNHVPGLAVCPDVRLAAICDTDEATLRRASSATGVTVASTRYDDILKRDDIHAVIVATPNHTHRPIALEAARCGKHILCEKPLGLTYLEAKQMAEAADHAGVRHMTAFTYRFVPAMRYLAYLVRRGDLGDLYHYRSCRLQDWGSRDLGWRQVKALAGSGELGDMLSHRIDFAHLLVGPMQRLVAMLKQWHPVRDGHRNDLDDWAALISEFSNGATGVLESSKLASGRNESWRSLDYVELNGADRSFVFTTGEWNTLQTGRTGGGGLETIDVPREFWKTPGSPRRLEDGNPLLTFRYDQVWEFVDAIRNRRPCAPSFHDGARAQAVMDAAIQSFEERKWVELDQTTEGGAG
ncbi:MAG TPA: Gfo/Idh/MocA family oxidoreductase, partial [Terriglobia bacterium]|nr:Gfo/Idh/MocA family oxidoreductase [Terriglobia bacterium]